MTLAEREDIVDALCAHFANGDLTMAELEQRLESAFRAASGRDLQALIADLRPLAPDEFDAGAAPRIAPPGSVPQRGMMIAVFGGAERSGGWIVPRHTKIFFAGGAVTLDLRTARLGPGVTEIEVTGIAGAAEIIVPPGVRVETVGTAFMGAFGADAGDPGPPSAEQPVLRVSGFVVWGGVEVSFKSPKKKALRRFEKAWRAARRLSPGGKASLPEGQND
ncbi:MAG TPA: DUF1707 domain-containing protein [Gemmatimonadaceae bacterium]|nr:DUF1707 domain-containing protein [Gemmatimonadaceae bacterium]